MNGTEILFYQESLKEPSTSFVSAKGSSAFERLPDEIIEQILRLTTPNVFASLVLLNRKWRTVSQQAHLYADHLARCPSYSAAHRGATIPEDEESLPRLRRLFAREAKRNLFDAYLRPRETIINLVSTSISSSSAPGGEAFHFSLSPRGHHILAYNSSRIHVIDVTGPEITVKRELKILRRPASTTITDNGLLLAVLSTDLQVDLYDLSGEHPKHTRAVALNHTPRTIALSPTGSVLAAAYDSGVEVSSLDPSFASTDRRSVKCYAADSLSFSRDGTQLLGTTMQSRNSSTVILTAPYYDPSGSLPENSVSSLWTTSILFPNGSRDCSHAVLLPNSSDGEVSWAFTYDRIFETFRAVRVNDLRNGTTYFTGPTADSACASRLFPSTLPTATESGDMVASGFQSSIWLYGVPEDLEAPRNIRDSLANSSESEVSTPPTYFGRRNSEPCVSFVDRTREGINKTPQWQNLGDRLRNTFVEGRMVGSLDRVSALAWVNNQSTKFLGNRLIAVAPGVGIQAVVNGDDGMIPADGGRISIMDFGYRPSDGERIVSTIEVGIKEPEVLEEAHRDLDTEVAIIRRRSVAQRGGDRNHVSRAAVPTRSPRPPPMPATPDLGNRTVRTLSQQTAFTGQSQTTDEDQEAFDAPYSQTNPRSGITLRRAASAAAVNRRFRPVAPDYFQYRRADGREEHPHESDADDWVPPPPPYTRDPLPLLPEHIQRSILAEAAPAPLERSRRNYPARFDFPDLDSGFLNRPRTIATAPYLSTMESRRDRIPFHRALSDSTNVISDRISFEEDRRPVTSPLSHDYDDIYDVSPQISPVSSPQPQNASMNQVPRRQLGAQSQAPAAVASSSPPPVMQATVQQPTSPIPQPKPLRQGQQRRERTFETINEGELSSDTDSDHSSSGCGRVQSQAARRATQVPPRPDNAHRLLGPPSLSPMSQTPRKIIELQEMPPTRSDTSPVITPRAQDIDGDPFTISQRAETEPAMPRSRSSQSSFRLSMPSPDQIARLNSRQGRPVGLADPRRLSAGPHSRNSLGASFQYISPESIPEQAFNGSRAPRAAVGAFGTSPQRHGRGTSPQGSPFSHSPQGGSLYSSPSRRPSGNTHSRNPATHSPSLRPRLSRLETIHSHTSGVGEPSPYFVRRSVSMGRQPGRAGRRAVHDIKDAKKGWRTMRKTKKDKHVEDTSSAGWADVSKDSGTLGKNGGKREGKCLVM
ncbi:uncharacterized protein L3040_009103 [Drepanopeziza brunnea f. sp. 'multigermtubi']|uniref:F-box domain-containing protein n=1 Tax=Marssonina brunnea f. sp. multigermtubi (strain MB_m1) TaxID=1072389 RepID=K1XSS8_MARBU|nr:F-box domain-containing protein [Drepanopeziza brunnea f. sp. 'multigermtubi' MB_m1]EKD15569.1 F-box domain-containing protein [Drepanopeziza brunnea f. sp. 'multigermtubi' MB_m1]KAJ5032501.1 hypothetical protein L3040_009103 [Drepanopeziza brunnea f. sp. 'multigermtubi']